MQRVNLPNAFFFRYNAHGFMPLSQWFETEKGIVQTQETGDVTLTSKLLSHQRTLGRYQFTHVLSQDMLELWPFYCCDVTRFHLFTLSLSN